MGVKREPNAAGGSFAVCPDIHRHATNPRASHSLPQPQKDWNLLPSSLWWKLGVQEEVSEKKKAAHPTAVTEAAHWGWRCPG